MASSLLGLGVVLLGCKRAAGHFSCKQFLTSFWGKNMEVREQPVQTCQGGFSLGDFSRFSVGHVPGFYLIWILSFLAFGRFLESGLFGFASLMASFVFVCLSRNSGWLFGFWRVVQVFMTCCCSVFHHQTHPSITGFWLLDFWWVASWLPGFCSPFGPKTTPNPKLPLKLEP